MITSFEITVLLVIVVIACIGIGAKLESGQEHKETNDMKWLDDQW